MILAFSPTFGLATATAAVLLYGLLALARKRLPAAAASAVLLAACFFHALTLAEGLMGQPPRFGFAPALSTTVWLVVLVYAIESKLIPELRASWALPAVGAAVVLLSLVFPGSSYTQIASAWLPLHWALGIASYGLFGAALLHGWLISRAELSMRTALSADTGVPLLKLERLTFRFVEAGFILLTASLLAGWFFAETLYGAVRSEPQVSMEPQDHFFSSGLAELCRLADRAGPTGLARPDRTQVSLSGLRTAAAGLRRLALCP